MKELKLSENIPRDKSIINKVPVYKGIIKYYVISSGMLLMGGVTFISIFFPPHEAGLVVFKSFCGLALITTSILLFKRSTAKIKARKFALNDGVSLIGKVVHHGRKFNPSSSTRYYTVKISYTIQSKQHFSIIKSSNKNIHADLPIGSETTGFETNRTKWKVFFPAEVGVKILL